MKLFNIPDSPGIYFFKNASGQIIYIGKATSLKRRVASYFIPTKIKKSERPIEDMIHEVDSVSVETTKNVIEAIIKEGIAIKKHKPKYNILGRDDKSLAYLVLTKENFPHFKIIRMHDFEKENVATRKNKYWKVFGPFLSARSVLLSLQILRKIFPYSDCKLPKKIVKINPRPCFYYSIGLCPGVCVGAISSKDYKSKLMPLVLFFEGKMVRLRQSLELEMKSASKKQHFELAKELRDKIHLLQNIQDVALVGIVEEEDKKSNSLLVKDAWAGGRIEGYDISHLGGKSTVGSMVVFNNGEPQKFEYKKFKIITATNNDVGAMAEMLTRRLNHFEWNFPDCILIDGGKPQINAVKKVFYKFGVDIKIVGLAKGSLRKKNEIIVDKRQAYFADSVRRNLGLLIMVRDEAHRFAITYQKKLRNIGIK